MIKVSFWRPSLQAYLMQARAQQFEWGQFDCALFVCGAIEAMTGDDLGKPYRGNYTTAAAGLKLIKKDGYKDHAAFAEAFLGEPFHPSLAMVGDIMVYQGDVTGAGLGVCNGERSYVLMPDSGLALVPTLKADRAYRI